MNNCVAKRFLFILFFSLLTNRAAFIRFLSEIGSSESVINGVCATEFLISIWNSGDSMIDIPSGHNELCIIHTLLNSYFFHFVCLNATRISYEFLYTPYGHDKLAYS